MKIINPFEAVSVETVSAKNMPREAHDARHNLRVSNYMRANPKVEELYRLDEFEDRGEVIWSRTAFTRPENVEP